MLVHILSGLETASVKEQHSHSDSSTPDAVFDMRMHHIQKMVPQARGDHGDVRERDSRQSDGGRAVGCLILGSCIFKISTNPTPEDDSDDKTAQLMIRRQH
jgi:hypothetical protein